MVVRLITLNVVGLNLDMRYRPSNPPCRYTIAADQHERMTGTTSTSTYHAVPHKIDLSSWERLLNGSEQDLGSLSRRRSRRHLGDHQLDSILL